MKTLLTLSKSSLLIFSILITTAQSFDKKDKQGHEFMNRIVGGDYSGAGEYPFMVSLHKSFNYYPYCGGSLVAPNLVLTAAHCDTNESGAVRIGSINAGGLNTGVGISGVERNVAKKIKHPEWNPINTENDLMLLELDGGVDTNTYKPVRLNFITQEPKPGVMLTVTGFGKTQEHVSLQSIRLMEVNVPANDHETCRSQYPNTSENIHLCAGYITGGKDSCQGDSGGPLFKYSGDVPIQMGVVSFGHGCARPNHSGVYARVSGSATWLRSEICNLSIDPKPEYLNCGGESPIADDIDTTATTSSVPQPDCVDVPGWYDSLNENCSYYAQENNCQFSIGFENFNLSALQACCVCGGGTADNSSGADDAPEADGAPEADDAPIADDATPVADYASGTDELWEVLSENGFEDNDKGDLMTGKVMATMGYTGSSSIRIRNKQKLSSQWIDIAGYDKLHLSFFFYAMGMENGDIITIEFRFDEVPWYEVASYECGTDFEVKEWKTASATVDANGDRLRFRLRLDSFDDNDKSRDRIFVDDMALNGVKVT